MYEKFTAGFHVTAGAARSPEPSSDRLTELFARFGGCTFDRGLYRVHDQTSSRRASQWVSDAYPEFKGRLVCFGFDWLGRQFALDPLRGSASEFEVAMLEPGTGYAMEVPVAFSDFHDQALEEYRDACLAPATFEDWITQTDRDLDFSECAGYKVPLFLGGKDELGNLEVSDMAVYWSIMGDLRKATQHLAPGTPVSGIDFIE
ncbi:T6SS immunity protein Tdi1 domain-containing protein [Arthrobacter sp. NPDC056727]|uniref:T6SS immunity protein Tdi1 domain-containing protein n=1 Tax=Arthrobacter sp. NPDC056727 TaxID=3345927 RepID=UPI00366E77D5